MALASDVGAQMEHYAEERGRALSAVQIYKKTAYFTYFLVHQYKI
ncbi:hypothetical protein [Paenibacillus popilliae]|nr:hypothetical protein [Paenibacillus popilliae]